MNKQRNILTEPEAVDIFSHLFDDINEVVKDSFDTVQEWIDFQKKKKFSMSLPSVNAMEMYGCIVNYTMNKFMNNEKYPEVKPILYSNSKIFGLRYYDSAFIRFKKVNDNFMPSKGNTEQAREINGQLETEYFPSKPCIITIGYKVDKTWSELQNINMLCLKNKEILWNYPIDRVAIPTRELEFPEFQENVSYNVDKLIKIKKTI